MGAAAAALFVLGPALSAIFGAGYITTWMWTAAFILATVMLLRGDTLVKKISDIVGNSDIMSKQLRRIKTMQSVGMIVVGVTSSVAVFAIIGGVSASVMFT